MSLAKIVRALVLAGATPEMILAAVEAAEDGRSDAIENRRANDAERQRRRREREDCHVTSRDVAVTERDPAPPPFFPPEPPQLPTPTPGITTRVRAAAPSLEADFERWWSAYPRRVGKGSARKAYLIARKKTAERVLLEALCRDWPADEKFIPHPATWLNGERWLDGADPPLLAAGMGAAATSDPWPKRLREYRANGYWNTTDWGPKPGKPGCLAPADGDLVEGQAA